MLDKFNAVYREIIAEANGRQLTVTDFISLLRNAGIEITEEQEQKFIKYVWNTIDASLKSRIARLDYNNVAKAIKNMESKVKEKVQKGFDHIDDMLSKTRNMAINGFKEAIPGLVAEFETVTESIVTEAEEYISARLAK